ncbi:MAG: hypothetical protein K1565_17480 [Candidatus Thiodiazotropha sp. (ex. Lucinisca nassula)]|nr:hypothetical protein [Candidatus Thiodiazotropha sp. (ex. Lucinisca nassula)]PUB90324.1 MAG: hypothetical protein DBP01_08090 [gamma proteobacterium symbiont of Ctena orbiculata]
MYVLRHDMFIVTGLLLFLIAGCSDEQANQSVVHKQINVTQPANPQQPIQQAFDPCALISHANTEEIVGASVTAPSASVDRLGNVMYLNCSSDDIHINIESWGDASKAAASYEFSGNHPSIEGLGDKARNTQPLGEVDVLYGSYIISVDLFLGLSRKDELDAAQEIARVVLDNLPD